MQVGEGNHQYEWIESWADVPDPEEASRGWAHHGVVVTSRGTVVAAHPARADLLEFDHAGKLLSRSPTGLTECHGITLVSENGTDYLWVVDTGRKYHYDLSEPQVVKMDLDGKIMTRLERPPHRAYQNGTYRPTWAAVYEERFGGNGDIWVADGYGSSLLHRYDRSGEYLSTTSGDKGQAGTFDEPHTIFVDTRRSEPELYIADRGNDRVQVFDLEGTFKRSFGSGYLKTPTGFGISGEDLVIIELYARAAIVDADDRLICYLGANQAVCEIEGWPNAKDARGEPIRTPHLQPGRFNSPHGMTVDGDGNIYVSEWLIGGRYTKLAPQGV